MEEFTTRPASHCGAGRVVNFSLGSTASDPDRLPFGPIGKNITRPASHHDADPVGKPSLGYAVSPQIEGPLNLSGDFTTQSASQCGAGRVVEFSVRSIYLLASHRCLHKSLQCMFVFALQKQCEHSELCAAQLRRQQKSKFKSDDLECL